MQCPYAQKIAADTVHPRACGELTETLETAIRMYGSSPRVRGTLQWRLTLLQRDRFIPARAGNSVVCGGLPVHPRACGELNDEIEPIETSAGSSPRVRGTRPARYAIVFVYRFIPARAGNSPPESPSSELGHPVHPRACGELPTCLRLRHQLIRFIPARAGNSL